MASEDIEKRSLIIRESFHKDQELLFKNIFNYTRIEDVKAAYPVSGGTEVVFVSLQELKKFLSEISHQPKVEHSESVKSVVVTVVPRVGDGHAQISDATIIAALSQYGEVEEGLRKTYKAFPTVETGAKLIKIKPRGSVSQLPTSLYFGKSIFGVVYRGQEQRCHRCGGGHKVTECKSVVCFKCRSMGHMSSSCKKPIVCTVCFEPGHSFKSCPAVKSLGDITLKTTWTKPVAEGVSTDMLGHNLQPRNESLGACGISSWLEPNSDVRMKTANNKQPGYGSVRQAPSESNSKVLVGPKPATSNINDSLLPLKEVESENNSQISDNELFAPANMSNRRDSYVSESESGSTVLDLENQIETRKVDYVPSSQDLFSQASQVSSHKRTRSLDRLDFEVRSSKLTKSGEASGDS